MGGGMVCVCVCVCVLCMTVICNSDVLPCVLLVCGGT